MLNDFRPRVRWVEEGQRQVQVDESGRQRLSDGEVCE
jgi:hypothetical protein